MILTDCYIFEKLTDANSRFDNIASTGEYDHFERLLINMKKFNIGGLSINCTPQPEKHKGKKVDTILSKGSHSITKIIKPDIISPVSYGDINGTNDACIIVFNPDYKETGIRIIEIFIARGAKHDKLQLWYLFTDGELTQEIELLRNKAVTKNVTRIE
jgi:hypothetical protein